jgi:ribosome-binding protein aMBF1 (putative translation factor)
MKVPTRAGETIEIRLLLRRMADGRWHASSSVVDPPPADGWPEDSAEFGQAVGRARLQQGLSLTALSEVVGVDPTTIRNIESARRPPSQKQRTWIVKALAKLGAAPPDPPTQEEENQDVPE